MVNVNKLKGKIVERGLTLDELAKQANISRSTLYKRMQSDGKDFTIEEADSIAKVLGLGFEEVNSIFFAQYVA